MKLSHCLSFFLILSAGLFSMGAVTKKQDPITLTQTDPVGYQEKKKEETEGKKSPPLPSMEFFPKERFLLDPPVDEQAAPLPGIPQNTELGTEDDTLEDGWETDEFKLEFETDDTWETGQARKSPVS